MSGYISIDVNNILDQIDDDDLLDEIKHRKLPEPKLSNLHDISDDLDAAYQEILRGRSAAALSILDRLLHPKWPSVDRCKDDFNNRHKT